MKERRLPHGNAASGDMRTEEKTSSHASYWTWPWRGEFKFSFWALLTHAESDGTRSKTDPTCCPAQKAAYSEGDISGLALGCGGTSSTEPSVCLGSPPYCNRVMN